MAGQPDKRAGSALKAYRSESYGEHALGLPPGESMIDVLEKLDIEELLENDIAHYRTVHPKCVPAVQPGSVIQANCGELYRTTGQKLPLNERGWRCPDCTKNAGLRPCPVCGEIDVPQW